jgi:hypothetical protein
VEASTLDLAGMSEQQFQLILEGAEKKQADLARERQAEQERQAAELAERQRIQQENERLRREAAERERVANEERQAREKKERDDAAAQRHKDAVALAEQQALQKKLEDEQKARIKAEQAKAAVIETVAKDLTKAGGKILVEDTKRFLESVSAPIPKTEFPLSVARTDRAHVELVISRLNEFELPQNVGQTATEIFTKTRKHLDDLAAWLERKLPTL